MENVINDKNEDFLRVFLSTGKIQDKIDYSHKREISKWKACKSHRNSWKAHKILKKLDNYVTKM